MENGIVKFSDGMNMKCVLALDKSLPIFHSPLVGLG